MYSLYCFARRVREVSFAAATPLAVLILVGACAQTGAERPGPGVRIVSATNRAVEAHVEGRVIRIAAREKECVFPGTVGVTRGVAHLVIGECVFHQPRTGKPVVTGVSGRSGVFSVSLLGADFPERSWEDFEDMILSDDGPTIMEANSVAEVIRDDLGVFVVTEGSDGGHDVICRAYTELNGRLAVVALLDPPDGADIAVLRARLTEVIEDLKAQNQRRGHLG
jgi:hypothetical protein